MSAPQVPATAGLKAVEVRRRHILPKALAVGLVAGLIASAFRKALQFSELGRIHWIERLPRGESLAVSLILGVVGGGLAVWLVRSFAPEAAGSGIPHLVDVVTGDKELRWKRVLPVKFLSGVLGIGGSLTLGREGPTVQMGGATGLMVSGWFKVKQGEGERRALISAGAAAGLAAAFNAPLASLIFVIEELAGSFTPVLFVASFLAAVTADVVCRVLTGETPVFDMRNAPSPSLEALPIAALIGVLSGLLGVLFNKCLLGSLRLADQFVGWPPFLLGACAGLVTGFAAWVYPGISGSGALLMDRAMTGEFTLSMLLLFLAVRFVLVMVSYGCGAAGGIFAPLLVMGSLGGLAVGVALHGIFPGWSVYSQTFAVISMGALFTASVRAPLTGIVLMVELTGKYDFMLPLLVSCFAAYGVAEVLACAPIYAALRARSREKAA